MYLQYLHVLSTISIYSLVMRISSAELEDGGTYYCHANNSLGQATQEVTLQVGAQYKYSCSA